VRSFEEGKRDMSFDDDGAWLWFAGWLDSEYTMYERSAGSEILATVPDMYGWIASRSSSYLLPSILPTEALLVRSMTLLPNALTAQPYTSRVYAPPT